jgi:PAS domain S-box-containing protein
MIEKIPKEFLEPIMDALPVEISFIDADDIVRYYNKNGKRIFKRTSSVIGKKVQNCHPKKSLNKVEEILKGFKSAKMDEAEFWIDLRGKKILIRYFPVRNENGKYLGCLEVTQDITDIQKIEGEKRLL